MNVCKVWALGSAVRTTFVWRRDCVLRVAFGFFRTTVWCEQCVCLYVYVWCLELHDGRQTGPGIIFRPKKNYKSRNAFEIYASEEIMYAPKWVNATENVDHKPICPKRKMRFYWMYLFKSNVDKTTQSWPHQNAWFIGLFVLKKFITKYVNYVLKVLY